jgi:hypothetical protein
METSSPRATKAQRRNGVHSDPLPLVRLTLYTTREKDFALKYVALKKGQSLNKMLNEMMDSLLKQQGIDPRTLPKTLP